ncbi:Hypothetical predicted protein [Lecanosticta acicola]|uniref:Uncharacterized protein n=1 Tax=Lecanosticta acicola TaxID=111012 RepID=A0AAI8Z2Y4_9PEZI|nr:Hypothetical predicted protein [Lecanosticta acicola]
MQRHLNCLKRQAIEATQPAAYNMAFGDHKGLPPLVRDYEQILDAIDVYCYPKTGALHRLAHDIDGVFAPYTTTHDSTQGYRKYLNNLDSRKKTTTTFLKHSRRMIHTVRAENPRLEEDELRIDGNPQLVGFSGDIGKRFGEHDTDLRSNFLMGLVRAASSQLFEGKRKNTQMVIFLIGKTSHAGFAEVLFTRLVQGYVVNGTGFSHYPAGIQVPLGRRSVQQWRGYWEWIKDNTPFLANHRRETKRLTDLTHPSQAETTIGWAPYADSLPQRLKIANLNERDYRGVVGLS